jgi:hypothetical protein
VSSYCASSNYALELSIEQHAGTHVYTAACGHVCTYALCVLKLPAAAQQHADTHAPVQEHADMYAPARRFSSSATRFRSAESSMRTRMCIQQHADTHVRMHLGGASRAQHRAACGHACVYSSMRTRMYVCTCEALLELRYTLPLSIQALERLLHLRSRRRLLTLLVV